HTNENGALTSDTERPTYSHISYRTNNRAEYYDDAWELQNPEVKKYGRDVDRTSDTVSSLDNSFNHSHGCDYLEYYDKEEQHDAGEYVDNWDDSAINENNYGFEYENQKNTSSKLLPMLPVNQNISHGSKSSKSSIHEIELKNEGMCINREKRNGVCMANAYEDENIYINPNGYTVNGYLPTLLKIRASATPSQDVRSKLYSYHDFFGLNTDSAFMNDLSMDQPGLKSTGSANYDVSGQITRPYTSMLPLDYSDCYHNAESLSTYSDTPPTNHEQLKVQQQRKMSLLMAMTTASVIASGETRVPVQCKHSKNPIDNTDPLLANSSSFNTKAATRASSRFESESCSGEFLSPDKVSIVESPLITAMATAPKTRKLPKLLPTLQYKSPLHTATSNSSNSDALKSPLYSTATITGKMYRPKQLPKLPISQNLDKLHSITMVDANITQYPGSLLPFSYLDQTSNLHSNLLKSTAGDADTSTIISNSIVVENKQIEVYSKEEIVFDPQKPIYKHPAAELVAPEPICNESPSKTILPTSETAKSDLSPHFKEPFIVTTSQPKSEISYEARVIKPETALFNISEYLKPYTLDTGSFSSDQEIQFCNTASSSNVQTINLHQESVSESSPSENIIVKDSDASKSGYANYDLSGVSSRFRISDPTIATITQSDAIRFNTSIVPVSNLLNLNIEPIVLSRTDNLSGDSHSPTTISPHDICTTLTLRRYSNAFTKTVSLNSAVMPGITSQDASPSASTLTLTSPSSVAPILSYSEYMKQFELPDLPQPILELSSKMPVTQSDSEHASKVDFETNADIFNTYKDSDITNIIEKRPSISKEILQLNQGPSQESPNYEYTNIPSNIINSVPTTIEFSISSTDPAFLTSKEVKVSEALAFDDTFYDTFNVDLKELTASVVHSETCLSNIKNLNEDNNIILTDSKTHENKIDLNQNLSSGLGNYNSHLKNIFPIQQSPTIQHLSAPAPQKAKVVTSAATSVLGGLSKGLKGGLDGVLSSVSAEVTPPTKKGFGLNLASKFVPSVGGLLSSASTNYSKQTFSTITETTTTHAKNVNIGTNMECYPSSISYEVPTESEIPIESQEPTFYNDKIKVANDITIRECNFTQIEHGFAFDSDLGKDKIVAYNSSYPQIELRNNIELKSPDIQKKMNTTGSMFGSIFGKAAAAVHSATQVVNQSASSVATVVAQKPATPQKHEPLMDSVGYDQMQFDYGYQSHDQQPMPNHYSNTGDDYENRNVQISEYTRDSNNKALSYLHSNGNQSQIKDDTVIPGKSQEMVTGCTILPAVPPAGSIGKKLPTINGKSGVLIKQMPTEIYDDESDVDIDCKSIIDKEPSYCIDSEQDDYYLDLQQTTPPNQSNGYYEHVNSGYDYREDYFNEEDEYKYLEQQRQQEQEPSIKKPLNQTKINVTHNQPQSSLELIDGGQDNDFIYENYNSEEDSGNYLDESSSGSVGPIERRKLLKMDGLTFGARNGSNEELLIATTNISNQLTPSHHQIQKQDSIFDEANLNQDELREEIEPELLDRDAEVNDQLTDLADLKNIISQKKKMLLRGETEEVVSGHMQIIRQSEITARQRWHWAYNKIIMQLNVSK
ncbi:hypothetical protein KR018_006618, partial [Drosophila ironensis]